MSSAARRKKKDKTRMPNNDLTKLVEQTISDYRAQNQITESQITESQCMTHRSERSGAYNLESVHETAEILLHQLTQSHLMKDPAPEQKRFDVDGDHPPLLVLARQIRTFTTYFCGMKKEKPVWAYQESLAARLDFAQAEKMVTTLGDGVFALPALERRAVANRRSW
jgi:hypothetical protein